MVDNVGNTRRTGGATFNGVDVVNNPNGVQGLTDKQLGDEMCKSNPAGCCAGDVDPTKYTGQTADGSATESGGVQPLAFNSGAPVNGVSPATGSSDFSVVDLLREAARRAGINPNSMSTQFGAHQGLTDWMLNAAPSEVNGNQT